jgi:hypothetical protein
MVSDPLAMNMSNTLGYLRGELKESGKVKSKKRTSWKRRVLELGPVKRMLLSIYNRIFGWYYS